MRGQAQAHSSVAKGTVGSRDDWRTPAKVLDRVRMLGPIDVDPCGNQDNSTGAAHVFSGPDGNGLDGLAEPWGDGLAFVNYPYSDSLPWAQKWTDEATKGQPIVVLAPARPDTAWHRLAAASASAVAFWRGRVTFELPPGISIYKVTDDDCSCSGLASAPGVLVAEQKVGHIYVVAEIALMSTYIECGLLATKVEPSPAPFPSVLYFYNLPIEVVARAFGDVADIYLPYRASV